MCDAPIPSAEKVLAQVSGDADPLTRERLAKRLIDPHVGLETREVVDRVARSAAYRAPDADRAQTLRNLAGLVPGNVRIEPKPGQRALVGPETEEGAHRFLNESLPSARAEALIDGRSIPIHRAKGAEANTPSNDEIARALAALDPVSRKQVRAIEVEAKKDPEGGLMANEAGRPGVVTIYPSDKVRTHRDMVAQLTHEAGHELSHRHYGDEGLEPGARTDPRWDTYRGAIAKDAARAGARTPSKYGGTNFGDDFAETWILYQRVKGTAAEDSVRRIFPSRFQAIDALLKAEK